MQLDYAECRFKKFSFVKEQEAKVLLNNFGIQTPLSKIPLLNVLFWMQFHWVYKMDEIVNKFLLADDKLMPEMHLK